MIVAFVILAAAGAVDLKHSCRAGKAAACDELGNRLEEGLGVRRDETRAAHLFRKACKEKNPDGGADDARALALREGQPADPRAALPRLETLCKQGRIRACAHRGDLFLLGVGAPLDATRAEVLLSWACDKGRVLAWSRLAPH